MYTMDRGLQEVAAGYAGGTGFAAGGRAVALPAVAPAGFGNNNILLIIIIIVVICACSGFGGESECCIGGRRRRRRGRAGSGLWLLIIGAFLLLGNNGGRNVNTNVVNVNAQDPGADDDFMDL